MLFISIVLIIITVALIALFIKNKYEEEILKTLRTDMVTLQAKIKIISEEVAIKKEGVAYLGNKVSESLDNEDIKKLVDEKIIDDQSEDYQEYYVLSKDNLKSLKLSKFDVDKIIVNYKTYEIIYINGFKVKDKTYYKLSDFNKIDEEKNKQENVQENNVIENVNGENS